MPEKKNAASTEPIIITFAITPQTTIVDGEEGWPVTVTGKHDQQGVVLNRMLSDWYSLTTLGVEVHEMLSAQAANPPDFPDMPEPEEKPVSDRKTKKKNKPNKQMEQVQPDQKTPEAEAPDKEQMTLF